jgi:hypothetical protein
VRADLLHGNGDQSSANNVRISPLSVINPQERGEEDVLLVVGTTVVKELDLLPNSGGGGFADDAHASLDLVPRKGPGNSGPSYSPSFDDAFHPHPR